MEGRIKGPDQKFCADCGEIISAQAEICPKCGVRQASFAVVAQASVGRLSVRTIIMILILIPVSIILLTIVLSLFSLGVFHSYEEERIEQPKEFQQKMQINHRYPGIGETPEAGKGSEFPWLTDLEKL